MTRLLDGFNYFWNLKPSTFKQADILFLHAWQKMLKETIGKTETEPLSQDDMYLIAKNIFKTSG